MFQEILKKFGLNYEQLNSAEKDTLEQMVENYTASELKVSDIRSAVDAMIESLTKELVSYGTPKTLMELFFRKKRRIHVEARLSNMLLIKDLLASPERARQALEKAIKNLKGKQSK